ncbi:hypothetical protein, partial [Kitasatospora cheerisanensis]|uniref:hypothetical protein n=1 Tax=Kitasatospora cheerisanensis TaxID=81942 RepID=UPI001AD81C98
MRSTGAGQQGAADWELSTPSWRLPGVGMAGFRIPAENGIELGIVPFPAVSIGVDLGDGPMTVDDGDRRLSGSSVIALGADGLRGGGRGVVCLQLRLSPLVAHAVLGGLSTSGAAAVSLADLWGREAGRLEERLRAAPSWESRFALVGAVLTRRLREGRPTDPEVAYAWRELVRTGGAARVDALAAEPRITSYNVCYNEVNYAADQDGSGRSGSRRR